MRQTILLGRVSAWILAFILGLVISGVTAVPLQTELDGLVTILPKEALHPIGASTGLQPWIELAAKGITETNIRYPFLSHGTDWLAFAYLVIAVAFIGPIVIPLIQVGHHVWLDCLRWCGPSGVHRGTGSACPALLAIN
ncbi:MAG TPA: hypothetical protein VLJ11_03800 [Bryobacteraceae bacterium]|nr:hypothetical protein [Bryobacteraceae bacterium]